LVFDQSLTEVSSSFAQQIHSRTNDLSPAKSLREITSSLSSTPFQSFTNLHPSPDVTHKTLPQKSLFSRIFLLQSRLALNLSIFAISLAFVVDFIEKKSQKSLPTVFFAASNFQLVHSLSIGGEQ
jgi:hypothetical protein